MTQFRPGRQVMVAGVGLHPFGRFPEKDMATLAVEAVVPALNDAETSVRCGAFSTYSLTKAWHVDHDSFLLDIVGPVLDEGGEEPRKSPENRCGDQQSAEFLEAQIYP